MEEANRLRIASRIHFILLRQLGTGIDIGTMLSREHYAREVLYVCDGSEDEELRVLARQFRDAQRIAVKAAAAAARRLRLAAAAEPARRPVAEPAWANDTSGFGYSLPPGQLPVRAAGKGWFNPVRWLSRPRPAR